MRTTSYKLDIYGRNESESTHTIKLAADSKFSGIDLYVIRVRLK